ncbi:MAG: OmpW family outer membrane protein [Acidobacteriota bacterium]
MSVSLTTPRSVGRSPVLKNFTRTLARPLAVVALAAVAWPAAADDDPWRLRGGAAWVDASVGFGSNDFESDGDLGAQVSVERMFAPRMGLEIGAMVGESSSDFTTEIFPGAFFSEGLDIDFSALTAALNFHFSPGRAVDLYVGPLVAFLDFGDTRLEDRRRIPGTTEQVLALDLDGSEEFALGAQVGADFGLGDGPWALNVSAKYFETEFAGTDERGREFDIDFEPLILGFGFSYRF